MSKRSNLAGNFVPKSQNNIIKFTQKELAGQFSFSLSTVFNALKTLRNANIIKVTGRFFILEDYKKLLYLWASVRNLKKDIYYSAFIEGNVDKIEGNIIPGAFFGLYSGFKFLYKPSEKRSIPSEYDHIYIYLEKEKLPFLLERIKIKEKKSTYPNFFVIEPDKWFSEYPQPIPEQIFVDIWNAPEWYAKDFIKVLEEEIL